MIEKMPQPQDEQDGQDRLFDVHEGAYGSSITYLDPENLQAPFEAPDKPKKLEDMTTVEMIRVAAQDFLVPDVYGHFSEKRGDFIRLYPWTPYSEGEATRAIGGGLINYALGANAKGGLSAVREVLTAVDKDRASALHAIETLTLVQDPEAGSFNPEWARQNTHVRHALAGAIFARNSLNLFEWPRHFTRKTKETRENPKISAKKLALQDELSRIDDETMTHLLRKTLAFERQRLKFWSDQTELTKQDPRSADIAAAALARG